MTLTLDSPVVLSTIGKQEIVEDIWTGTRGPRNAEILIVGEAWGENERAEGKSFTGASGKEFDAMLAEAGINPKAVLFTTLINYKPSGNDFRMLLQPNERGKKGLFGDGISPTVQLEQGLQKLDRIIETLKPRIIIATGNWPMWYLTRKGNAKTDQGYKIVVGVDSWRGSQLFLEPSPWRTVSGIPVLPVYHPAAVLRMYPWRKITVQDLRRATKYIAGQMVTWDDPKKDIRKLIVQPTGDEIVALVESWIKSPDNPIVLDVETKKYRLHIVGLTRDGETCYAIPFFHITPHGFRPTYLGTEWEKIYCALYKLFNFPGLKFVGQNLSYDMQFIAKFFHATPKIEWDTIIGQHVAFPALRKGLDYQSSMYCEHHVYWKDDLKESTDTMDTRMACLYNCVDLYRTFEIWQVQTKLLPALGKLPQFLRRMSLFPVLMDMMVRGININDRLRQEYRGDLLRMAWAIGYWLDEIVPQSILREDYKGKSNWYQSPTYLSWFLYTKLKLRPIIDRKTKSLTTNKEALVELGDYYPQYRGLFSAILLLRSIMVIAGNILNAPLERDGRMRTVYNLAGPDTYRLASSENVWGGGGNLQNVPRDREDMSMLEADLI